MKHLKGGCQNRYRIEPEIQVTESNTENDKNIEHFRYFGVSLHPYSLSVKESLTNLMEDINLQ